MIRNSFANPFLVTHSHIVPNIDDDNGGWDDDGGNDGEDDDDGEEAAGAVAAHQAQIEKQ